MSIIFQLSSQLKECGEQSNRRVTGLILQNPDLLEEIIDHLNSGNAALLGDCVEVCTMIAEKFPELINPYIEKIIPLTNHKNNRVRWEAMHTIALMSVEVPEAIFIKWDYFSTLFLNDKSVIVRDYIVTCAGNLASCGESYAKTIYPFLLSALDAHNTHHAKLALEGIIKAIPYLSNHFDELDSVAELFIQHPKPSISKTARTLKKKLSSFSDRT